MPRGPDPTPLTSVCAQGPSRDDTDAEMAAAKPADWPEHEGPNDKNPEAGRDAGRDESPTVVAPTSPELLRAPTRSA